jgi:hypothetical protein
MQEISPLSKNIAAQIRVLEKKLEQESLLAKNWQKEAQRYLAMKNYPKCQELLKKIPMYESLPLYRTYLQDSEKVQEKIAASFQERRIAGFSYPPQIYIDWRDHDFYSYAKQIQQEYCRKSNLPIEQTFPFHFSEFTLRLVPPGIFYYQGRIPMFIAIWECTLLLKMFGKIL